MHGQEGSNACLIRKVMDACACYDGKVENHVSSVLDLVSWMLEASKTHFKAVRPALLHAVYPLKAMDTNSCSCTQAAGRHAVSHVRSGVVRWARSCCYFCTCCISPPPRRVQPCAVLHSELVYHCLRCSQRRQHFLQLGASPDALMIATLS
jgi:hypothetical protein